MANGFRFAKIWSEKSGVTPRVQMFDDLKVVNQAVDDNISYALENGYLSQSNFDKYGDMIKSRIFTEAYPGYVCGDISWGGTVSAGDYVIRVIRPEERSWTPEEEIEFLNEHPDRFCHDIIRKKYYKCGKGGQICTKEEEKEWCREELQRTEQQLKEVYKKKADLYNEMFGSDKKAIGTNVNLMLTGM